jgi:hypothetical protein
MLAIISQSIIFFKKKSEQNEKRTKNISKNFKRYFEAQDELFYPKKLSS